MVQDKLNAEHLDKLAKYAPETNMTSNVWCGFSAELAPEAARAKIEHEGFSYKTIKDMLEESMKFDRIFAMREVDKDVEMGTSSAAPGSESQASVPVFPPLAGCDASLDAPGANIRQRCHEVLRL